MLTCREIRQQFVDFFTERHGHTFAPSSPVVPHADPTLLFTNAGMNQFKDVFLGTGTRPYRRAVNFQKCIRAGGKHNDLEDVGRDTYHHTFFEMLGNWSFGDYFKREAIAWAWQLLTEVWGLDKSRLHATVFAGDASDRLERDDEAAALWREVTDIDPSHVHWFGRKENFWEMGDTGPCGPCSEIHVDLTPERSGGGLVNSDDPRVMEVWNLVFIQFNRNADGSLTPLAARHVDTGMGFERIAAVLQGKRSNYDTDLFTPLFQAIAALTGAREYRGLLEDPVDVAYRVLADHLRCLTVALTDGALPGNEGRGYVLRRILRRAAYQGRQILGVEEPFLHRLVPAVVDVLGQAFPELRRDPAQVAAVIRDEEESFGRTLDRGIAHFEEAASRALVSSETTGTIIDFGKASSLEDASARAGGEVKRKKWDAGSIGLQAEYSKTISGDDAFLLYDTFGFPLDLTCVMARERGLSVDVSRFEERMAHQREVSRDAVAGRRARDTLVEAVQSMEKLGEISESGTVSRQGTGLERLEPIRESSRVSISTEFVGYDSVHTKARSYCLLFAEESERYVPVERASAGQRLALVVARTPFYAEAGGQVGDRGTIHVADALFEVEDTVRVGNVQFHLGTLRRGTIAAVSPGGGEVALSFEVANERRRRIMANHTATHLLNLALRSVLGDHVQQKGSLVDDEKTRFDFAHGKSLQREDLERIEAQVNQAIEADLEVFTGTAAQQEAMRIHGLRAVFGEKYPPIVRVVSIGVPVAELLADPEAERWYDYSVEFCGGTHLPSTGAAQRFVVTGEEAVAKGVRRITAVTGERATAAKARTESLTEVRWKLYSSSISVADVEYRKKVTHGSEAKEIAEQEEGLARLEEALRAELPVVVAGELRGEVAELRKRLRKQDKEKSRQVERSVVDRARELAETLEGDVLVAAIDGADADSLRTAMDVIRQKRPETALLLGCAGDDKCFFVAAVPPGWIQRGLKAGDWVREVAKVAGGGGGGRPDMAQAGGKDPSRLGEALSVGRRLAESKA